MEFLGISRLSRTKNNPLSFCSLARASSLSTRGCNEFDLGVSACDLEKSPFHPSDMISRSRRRARTVTRSTINRLYKGFGVLEIKFQESLPAGHLIAGITAKKDRRRSRRRRRSVYFPYCWSLPNNLPLSLLLLPPSGLSAATYLSVIANFSKLSFIAGLLLCRFHSKHFIELHSGSTKEPTALPQFILRFYSPCESAGPARAWLFRFPVLALCAAGTFIIKRVSDIRLEYAKASFHGVRRLLQLM